MEIYKQEILDGLQEKIFSTASIAFAHVVEHDQTPHLLQTIQKAFAGKLEAKEGLYPTKSILVSTVWNLNDDVFEKLHVWKARATPEDKPTNLGHDEKQIVGHITGNWVVAKDGTVIDPNTAVEDLPESFHIVNSAVIYTLWQDKELIERTQALIADIEAGKKFVSMECSFRGFDYAVKAPDGKYHVIARNESTAFLSKHLRAYGGDGVYKDHKIGRILKDITFSGKGYVDKPANPESIILKGDEVAFSSVLENAMILEGHGVSTNITIAESKMSVEFEKQIADLTKKLAENEVALAKLTVDLKTANDKIADLSKASETDKNEIKTLNEKLTAEAAKSCELTKALEDTSKAKANVDQELATIKAAELKARRVAQLVDGGVAKDVAEAKVVAFASFTDEQFGVVAEALITAAKAAKPNGEADIDTDPAGEAAAKAAAEAAEAAAKAAAEKNKVINPPAEEDKTVEKTRASLRDYFESRLGIKKAN